MPVIGITGGIATGKSTLCECLRALTTAMFFDADKSARELAASDPETKALIRDEFGESIYSAGGDLNRAQLRAIVFADAEKKRALEQILHPRIRRQWSTQAESRRNSAELFLADIPLLYETAGETLCDRVVVVACSEERQLERLMQRMAIARTEAAQMIASQMPLTEKISRADHVVWNNGERDVLVAQARLLVGLWSGSEGRAASHRDFRDATEGRAPSRPDFRDATEGVPPFG